MTGKSRRRAPGLARAGAGFSLALLLTLAGCSSPSPTLADGGASTTGPTAEASQSPSPASPVPPATETGAGRTAPVALDTDLGDAVGLLNERRAAGGAGALATDEGLVAVARSQVEHYADGGEEWSGHLGDQLAEVGFATGAARARTASSAVDAVDAWLADEASASDLLDAQFSRVGIATAALPDGRPMVVVVVGYRADDGAIPPESRGAAEALELTNAERAAFDLPALTSSGDLDRAAQVQADHQAAILTMTHEGNGGLGSRLGAVGYLSGAENVAAGQRSVAEVVQGWIESPGHHENIVHPGMTEMGFAVAFGADGRSYWAQVFGTR